MDRISKGKRSKNMRAIKNKGSKIEMLLRSALINEGYDFNTNDNSVIGKPDIVFLDKKIAIFCDSEFWHGKDWENRKNDIKSNKKFWFTKIENNIQRDKKVNSILKSRGWKVLRFWGEEIMNNVELCVSKIDDAVVSEPKFLKYSQIKKYNCDNNKFSYISHYLQSHDSLPYVLKSKGAKYLKEFKEYSGIVGKDMQLIIPIEFDVPFPPPYDYKFTFIDLFAGIGGFRIAFQNLKGKCLFSSEIDPNSQKTYEANFGEVPFGDITKIDEKDIPNHDVLLAGFPCQAFSIAGRRGGFEDTRGTLFFDVARIIKEKKPKAFFLENVKGLTSHNKGETLKVILNTLRNDLNYYVPDPKIMNAKNFGVPQNRERIFIVGFRKDLNIDSFSYPKSKKGKKSFSEIREENEVSVKYYLSTQYLKTLRNHKERHSKKGNGFGYEIINDDSIANAIVVGGMGRERNLVIDNRLTNFIPITKIKGEVNREGVRKMTPREWARLQGYPDKFQIVVSDAQAYKQFGNSVAVPAIQATGEKILSKLQI